MATKVAELAVDITTNFAKVHEGLKEVSNSVNKAAEGMKGAFSEAGKSLLGFAAGAAGAASIIGGLKSALDFGDQLQTSNEKLGISVEKLQELSGIAVQNNTSIEALGKSFKFLGDSMLKAQTAGSEQNRLFAALGVATKDAAGNLRAVDEVTADTADALNQISNETVRTAAGVAIFGKSYLEIAAALRTFKESQEAARIIMEQFGTVTATVTKTADAFGDKLNLLGQGFKAATLVGITPGISALNSALEAITPTIAVVSKAFGDFFGWLGTQAAVWIINAENLLRKLGAAIGAVAASIATMSLGPLKELEKDIARLDVERVRDVAKALTAAKFPGLDEGDQVSRAAGALQRLEDRSKAVAAALGGVSKEFESAFGNMAKILQTAQERFDDYGKSITEQTSPSMKALISLLGSPEWAKFSKTQQDQLINMGLAADAIDHETAALKKLEEETKQYNDIVNRARDAQNTAVDQNAKAVDDFVEGLKKQNEEYEFQISLVGKTATEIEILTAKRNIDLKAAEAASRLNEQSSANDLAKIDAAKNLGKQNAENNARQLDFAKQQQAAFMEMYNSLTQAASDFIVDFVEHGSSAFKNLWESFKHWALEAIAKIAAQQIVMSIIPGIAPAAGIASGAAGGLGGLLNLFGGGGSGGLFGIVSKLFSPLESLFSGGGILGSIGTSFANLNVALTGGIGAIGGFGAGLTSLLPALGAIGGAIGLAVAAFNLIGKGGGPKEGGLGGSGLLTGGPGDYFAQEYTDAGNKAAQALTDSIAKSFDEAMKRLGGKGAGAFGFDLGFDTDPRGTAPSRSVGGVYQGGANIYKTRNENIGRTPEELQAALQQQAQQMLLAALQASDLPRYVAAIINSVDAASASSDQIASILATAEAIKNVADAFPALQTQLEGLDPDQIKAFIDALGGADQLGATFAYLQKNFTTTTDVVKETTDKLTADFDALGLAVPKSHQGFLDLLSSFDLTTEAGRELYASVAALAPEFVAVAGSADEAAKKLQDAGEFFKQNFYSDAEKNAASIAEATRELDAAQAQLGITIPRTAEAFRALIEGINRTTPAGEALYNALIVLAPQLLAVSGGIKAVAAAAAAAIPIIHEMSTVFGDIQPGSPPKIKKWIERLRDLAKEAGGDLGDQLSFMVDAIGKEIDDVKAQMADALKRGDLWTYDALRELITSLQNSNNAITGELAEFITLSAKYDAAKAEQLINLEKWYKDQQKIYGGDAVLLDALAKIFARKWDEIIKGTSDGVDGTQSELDRLRKSIADYLKSLQVSDLSPLTPAQKLAEAQKQYEEALAKAAKGDPQALADITKFADAYLKQARDFYASSPLYADIFKQITEALAALAGTTTDGSALDRLRHPPGPGPHGDGLTNSNWDALTSALPPPGGRLASADDLKRATDSLGKLIADALAAVADAATEDATTVVDQLKSTAVTIVDGLGGNLK